MKQNVSAEGEKMLGVCLKYEQNNYGSKLQALATLKMLEEMGIEYEIIRYRKDIKFYIKSLPRFVNFVFLNDRYDQIQRKIEYARHKEVAEKVMLRKKGMAAFDDEHFTAHAITYKNYDALKKECVFRYDKLLTCSDQLWSPSALGSGFYNLMFAPDDMPKVSWASSFGVNKIPWYQIRRTRNFLNRIQHISMREIRGIQIVKELTGREVPVLMDPVFAFDKNEWNKFVPDSRTEWENYIFCYFLGSNQKHRQAAKKLSKQTGLKIVTLKHLDRFVSEDEYFGDYAPYDVDPYRFLNILKNAEFICTDSFHGTAFSLIFEKKFIVFDRYDSSSSNSKNSRIDSLCQNLNISNRRYTPMMDMDVLINSEINYGEVQNKLERYRREAKDYLHKTLK